MLCLVAHVKFCKIRSKAGKSVRLPKKIFIWYLSSCSLGDNFPMWQISQVSVSMSLVCESDNLLGEGGVWPICGQGPWGGGLSPNSANGQQGVGVCLLTQKQRKFIFWTYLMGGFAGGHANSLFFLWFFLCFSILANFRFSGFRFSGFFCYEKLLISALISPH